MSVKTNIIANYAGSIWTALMGLVFVPTYIKFLGIEAYGLVGFFGTLLAMFSILDLGLSATLNREMARRSTSPELFQTTRDLLRTIEAIYWGMAVLIGAAVVFLSYPISQYWINPGKLSIEDVQQAVMIMGLVVVLRWPFGMYQGGLMGLQRQVLANAINSVSATLRGLGAVIVLWLISPTIQAFFFWQIVVSGAETMAMAVLLWKSLPMTPYKSRFKSQILTDVWRFAGGIMSIHLVVLILTQTDKILLSKLLSLEDYGYYMFAWTVASILHRVTGPIFSSYYPKFSQLVVSNNVKELADSYHKSCQFVSVMVLPLATVLAFFSAEIVNLWTGNPELAANSCTLISLLVIGTAFNALMNLPYALQLAYGWTSLNFWINVASIFVLIPSLFFLVNLYGSLGGAIVWIALNLGYILFGIAAMHRKILRHEKSKWFKNDVFVPLLVAASTAYLFANGVPFPAGKVNSAIYIFSVVAFSFVLTSLFTQETRKLLIHIDLFKRS